MKKITILLSFIFALNLLIMPKVQAALSTTINPVITLPTVSNLNHTKITLPSTNVNTKVTPALIPPKKDIKINTGVVKTIDVSSEVQIHNANIKSPIALSQDIGAILSVCDIGESCYGDMGSTHWMKNATINVTDAKRGLSWYTNVSAVKDGLLEVSLTPFDDSWPSKAFYSKNIIVGTSVFDFRTLSQPKDYTLPAVSTAKPDNKYYANNTATVENNSSSVGIKGFFSSIWNFAKNTVETPINYISNITHNNAYKIDINVLPTYYLRVVPLINGKIAGAATNQVVVKTVNPPDGFKFYTPPKIYEVKIKEFDPLLAPDKGVCSNAMILDTDAYVSQPGSLLSDFKKAGDRICPSPFMGIGEKSWYEQLWDGLKSGLSWVSKAYDTLKSSVVDIVGSVACAGDSTCKMALSAGLDIGLTAMGLPPTIPNFDQLSDQGLNYLASEISSQVGCPDVACGNLIKDNLKKAISQSTGISSGCMDTAAAHDRGMEPICLSVGAKAHWDPAATYRDAKVVLEVYRNNIDDPNENTKSSGYRIDLSNQAYNANSVGGWITNIEPDNEKMQITKPLQASLFDYKSIPIPHMEKGQTMDIPINLVASEYWVPGHKELMHGWSTVIYHDGWPQYQYDDWWLLYYGANLSLSARVSGCPYGGDDNSCIISSGTLKTTLPMTLNP